MDYQVFLVRQQTGRSSTRGGGGSTRLLLLLLRVLEHGISVSPLSSSAAAATNNLVAEDYISFEHIAKVTASQDDPTELSLEVLDCTPAAASSKKQQAVAHGHHHHGSSGSSYHTLRFFCDSRSQLLTVLFNRIDDVNGIGTDFLLKKHSNQRGGFTDTVLRVRSASIIKMVNTGHRQERLRRMKAAKRVNFQDIVKLETLTDEEHIVLVYLNSRVMRLSLKDPLPFLLTVQQNMKSNLKLDIEIGKITSSTMLENVATYPKKMKESPIVCEFEVTKRQDSTKQERQRKVCMTKDYFFETWVDHVVSVHSLKDILGVIVSEKDVREVTLEFRSWRATQYFLDEREDFVASITDLIGISKSTAFSIRLESFFSHALPEMPSYPAYYQHESEAYFLNRFIGTFYSIRDDPAALHLTLKEYACNVHVGDSQCNDSKVLQAVTDYLKECVGNNSGQDFVGASTCCIVLQRLLASRPCFEAIRNMPDVVAVIFQCMRSENSVLVYLATVVVRAAIKLATEPSGSTEGGSSSSVVLRQEFANKLTVLSAENLQQLVAFLRTHSLAKNNSLQVVGLLDTFTLALTSQSVDNEAGRMWLKAFEASMMAAADVFCEVSRSPSASIFKSTSELLKALFMRTSPLVSAHLQKLCLGRCVVLVQLKMSIFSKWTHIHTLSGNLVYLMMEGNLETQKLLKGLVPKGVMQLYCNKVVELSSKEKSVLSKLHAWMETLEVLRGQTLETPVLVWNDLKRKELKKFLQDEVEGFYEATAANPELVYNSADVKLVYSSASEGEGSVVGDVHLELLVDHSPPPNSHDHSFWKLREPLSIFQSVFQAMVLGFTPLFGHNNLPEIDLRLASHVLTWIYERHADEVTFCMETLNVIETAVGMLREVLESVHEVFVFKLVVFLLATVEKGGHDNVLRFLRGGGASVLVPLVVLSLAKCCADKHEFECDAWTADDSLLWTQQAGAVETVTVVGSNGDVRLVRIPSGRPHELLMRASELDGSLDARDAIKWQDENVHVKIQLGIALDFLEALLRISGNDSNNGENFPPSAACCHFSREEIFCHLVQALLRAKTPIFTRILEIIITLTKANKTAMSHLYKLGAFEILLWKLLASDIVDGDKSRITKFLSQTHLLQSITPDTDDRSGQSEHGTSGCDSSLYPYLPEGVILNLMSEGPDTFMALLDSEQNGPEVIWNTEMRKRLLDHLTTELESYVKFRATDPLALYIHVPRTPLAYPELAESVFSAPFYLQNLLDIDRFPNYPINDPVRFLNSLMLDLRRFATVLRNNSLTGNSLLRKELPHIHLLLQAQAHLVDRFPDLVLPSDIESILITLATPSLQMCLAQKDKLPLVAIDILHHTVRILWRYCDASRRDDGGGGDGVPRASVNFGLSVLSLLGTKSRATESFPAASTNTNLESAVAGSLFVMEIASSSRVGRRLLWDDTRWQEGFWWVLSCIAASDDDALATPLRQGLSPASFAVLSCFKHFAEDPEYCTHVIKQALHLPLLLLAIPHANDIASKVPQGTTNRSTLLYSAADTLGSLIRTLKQAVGHNPSVTLHSECTVMTYLIPAPLLACLEQTDSGPDKFTTMASSDIRQPSAFWTSDMRAELHRRIMERMQEHHPGALASSSPSSGSDLMQDDELEWLQGFRYHCLQDELILGGLFVNGFTSEKWEAFGLPTGHAFLDAMLDYLETKLHVISLLARKGVAAANDKTTEKEEVIVAANNKVSEFLAVLVALRECLRYGAKCGRPELIQCVHPLLLSRVALAGKSMPQVQIEIATMAKILIEDDDFGREGVLQSNLMGTMAVQLWECVARRPQQGQDNDLLVAMIDMLHTLSERIPATIGATNIFATTGLLLPLLAIFCKVALPDLRTGVAAAMTVNGSRSNSRLFESVTVGRVGAAKILGQLLLTGSGFSNRTKLVQDVVQKKRLANGSTNHHSNYDEGIGEATDMYELMGTLLDPVHNAAADKKTHAEEESPMVIRTLLLLLPVDLLCTLARDATKACKRYDGNYQSPRLVWDDGTRLCVTETLTKEAFKLLGNIVKQQEDLSSLPAWSLVQTQPVFLRWILVTISYGESKVMTYSRDSKGGDDYARELYLGGFFVDHFLRDPGYDFGSTILETRFLCEIRKAVVIGAYTQVFGFDDRRRLLLTLLLLFKARPYLLSGQSNIDIFLPVSDFISGNNHGSECRALAQPALLLIHSIANHPDIVDCIISDELVSTLVSFLDLNVPSSAAGCAGTDPRMCTLMLLLRLTRLSSATVEIALKLGVISRIAGVAFDSDENGVVVCRALECLAMMCAHKRRGREVSKLLEKLAPKHENKNYGKWRIPIDNIHDDVVDSETIKHLLRHRYPCKWWVLNTPEGRRRSDVEGYDAYALKEKPEADSNQLSLGGSFLGSMGPANETMVVPIIVSSRTQLSAEHIPGDGDPSPPTPHLENHRNPAQIVMTAKCLVAPPAMNKSSEGDIQGTQTMPPQPPILQQASDTKNVRDLEDDSLPPPQQRLQNMVNKKQSTPSAVQQLSRGGHHSQLNVAEQSSKRLDVNIPTVPSHTGSSSSLNQEIPPNSSPVIPDCDMDLDLVAKGPPPIQSSLSPPLSPPPTHTLPGQSSSPLSSVRSPEPLFSKLPTQTVSSSSSALSKPARTSHHESPSPKTRSLVSSSASSASVSSSLDPLPMPLSPTKAVASLAKPAAGTNHESPSTTTPSLVSSSASSALVSSSLDPLPIPLSPTKAVTSLAKPAAGTNHESPSPTTPSLVSSSASSASVSSSLDPLPMPLSPMKAVASLVKPAGGTNHESCPPSSSSTSRVPSSSPLLPSKSSQNLVAIMPSLTGTVSSSLAKKLPAGTTNHESPHPASPPSLVSSSSSPLLPSVSSLDLRVRMPSPAGTVSSSLAKKLPGRNHESPPPPSSPSSVSSSSSLPSIASLPDHPLHVPPPPPTKTLSSSSLAKQLPLQGTTNHESAPPSLSPSLVPSSSPLPSVKSLDHPPLRVPPPLPKTVSSLAKPPGTNHESPPPVLLSPSVVVTNRTSGASSPSSSSSSSPTHRPSSTGRGLFVGAQAHGATHSPRSPHSAKGPVNKRAAAVSAPLMPSPPASPLVGPVDAVPLPSPRQRIGTPTLAVRSSSMKDALQSAHTDVNLVNKSTSNVVMKSEAERMNALGKALALVLDGAEIKQTRKNSVIASFLEAFEDQEELGRMIHKYPKLVQKHALQPQLCYDLMCLWEENCLDLLLNDEQAKYGKSIAAIDMCQIDDPDAALEEAKKKFQAILKMRKEKDTRERSKQTKGDISADLNRTPSWKKERLARESSAQDTVSKSRVSLTQKVKKKGTWS
ncbi:hypothetical protein CY35_05G081400 [Sphagnum magellanicum]|nr:hypothetical protein CY35_05G081400 [Sphagnum magellanicum]